jgi:all-trans-retinol 13,14-reductase
MNDMRYDCIVIGAGLGGLTAACTLARSGAKVGVVEKHTKVGGYATCFQRKGFTFDSSLHNYGALFDRAMPRTILNELNVADRIRVLPYGEFQRVVFPEHDLVIPKGVEAYAARLKQLFPRQASGIDSLFTVMRQTCNEFDEIEGLDLTPKEIEKRFPHLAIKFPNLVTLFNSTFQQLMDAHLTDECLKSIIGNPWWIAGLPSRKVAAILYILATVQYYQCGGGTIEGTSQRLSDAFQAEILAHDGEVMLGTEATKIEVRNGRVDAVLTNRGHRLATRFVLSNVSPHDTILRMLEPGDIEPAYRERIAGQELSLSCSQLYLGLDVKPSKLGMNCHSITLFDSYDHEAAYEAVCAGRREESLCCMTDLSAFDTTIAPPGCGILVLMTLDHIADWRGLSLEQYREKKESVSRALIDKARRIMPEITSHIKVAELATPCTMERYTGNPDGAIFGYSHLISQSGLNRVGDTTPLEGLYQASAYTYPGGGFSSVITSGHTAAKHILSAA